MLTTEVVKGLLAGKVYSRSTVDNDPVAMKLWNETVMIKEGNFPWREMIFDLLDLQGD
jgi:hypothetical protein